jgi:16S rRNA (cytidine1402-2'-O)-methyltransferase
MPGTLFVVATPIGNLEDLTFRALRTLREVDLIAAEDTRRTAKLLAHYEVRKPMVSLREHNEFRETPRLVARLMRGENIALVSDAGTPGIADPGARLVRAVREAGLIPVPIPGPSAVTAALSVSGFDASQFVFMGFPPPKGSERAMWMSQLKAESRMVVALEAPHRIVATISDICNILVKRQITTAREITKLNYELAVWPSVDAGRKPVELGEYVVVVPALHPGASVSPDQSDPDGRTSLLFGYLTDYMGVDEPTSRLAVSVALGVPLDAVRGLIRAQLKLAKKQKMSKP